MPSFFQDSQRKTDNHKSDATANREKLLKKNFLIDPPRYPKELIEDKRSSKDDTTVLEGKHSSKDDITVLEDKSSRKDVNIKDNKARLSVSKNFLDKLDKWYEEHPYPPHKWLSPEGSDALMGLSNALIEKYRNDEFKPKEYKDIENSIIKARQDIDIKQAQLNDRQKQSLSKIPALVGELDILNDMQKVLDKGKVCLDIVQQELEHFSEQPENKKECQEALQKLSDIRRKHDAIYVTIQKRQPEIKWLLRINNQVKSVEAGIQTDQSKTEDSQVFKLLQDQFTTKQTELANKTKEITEAKKMHEAKITAKSKEITAKDKEITDQKQAVELLNEQLKKAEVELVKEKKERSGAETTHKADIEAKDKEISTQKQVVEQLQKQFEEIKTEFEKQTTAIAKVERTHEEEITVKAKEIADLQGTIADLQGTIAQLNNELDLRRGNLPPQSQRSLLTQLISAVKPSSKPENLASSPKDVDNQSLRSNPSSIASTPRTGSFSRTPLNRKGSFSPMPARISESPSAYVSSSFESETSITSTNFKEHQEETVKQLQDAQGVPADKLLEIQGEVRKVCNENLKDIVSKAQDFFEARTSLEEKKIDLLEGEKLGTIGGRKGGIAKKVKDSVHIASKEIIKQYEEKHAKMIELQYDRKQESKEYSGISMEYRELKVPYDAIMMQVSEQAKNKVNGDEDIIRREKEIKDKIDIMSDSIKTLERSISLKWGPYRTINQEFSVRRQREIKEALKGKKLSAIEQARTRISEIHAPIRMNTGKIAAEDKVAYLLRDYIELSNYRKSASRKVGESFSKNDDGRILIGLKDIYKELKELKEIQDRQENIPS